MKTPLLDRLIAGGTLVTGSGRGEVALGIREGRVAWVGDSAFAPEARETLDLTGRLVFLGVVDPHVHFRPRSADNDDLAQLSLVAAHGGGDDASRLRHGQRGRVDGRRHRSRSRRG